MNEREDFHFDLGVDHQVEVNYKVKQEIKGECGFFKKRTKVNFYQAIEITNKSSSNIKLTILANYPKPNKKDDVKVVRFLLFILNLQTLSLLFLKGKIN